MEITSGLIYWISRLDRLNEFLQISFLLSFLAVLLATLYLFNEDHLGPGSMAWKIRKIAIFLGIFFAFGYFFIPSQKEIAAIIIIPKLVANQELRKLPKNFVDLTNEWIGELKPSKEKK